MDAFLAACAVGVGYTFYLIRSARYHSEVKRDTKKHEYYEDMFERYEKMR
ncbi:MAG: hypothetical protein J7L45_01910 [Candidatus Aenigmarchaeota archaeon]|nr:hypothetical protein [Candidatus Aenigmarchaeota archaeon]